MTSLKSSGKIDFPENLEQEWGWSHDPVWGVHRILHFLAFLLGASVTQIKVEWLPRGYLKFFSPRDPLRKLLGLPRISTPLFSIAVVLKILKSGKDAGEGLGRLICHCSQQHLLGIPPEALLPEGSLCTPSLKLHWNPDTLLERERAHWPEGPQAKHTIPIIRQDL